MLSVFAESDGNAEKLDTNLRTVQIQTDQTQAQMETQAIQAIKSKIK